MERAVNGRDIHWFAGDDAGHRGYRTAFPTLIRRLRRFHE
jgi:hypothetical protein